AISYALRAPFVPFSLTWWLLAQAIATVAGNLILLFFPVTSTFYHWTYAATTALILLMAMFIVLEETLVIPARQRYTVWIMVGILFSSSLLVYLGVTEPLHRR